MNEWEFTADVASWINEHLAVDKTLPFSRAKCEQKGRGSNKRRDLTLLDKDKRVCLTGEVKLPYNSDGGSPFVHAVVEDARRKAARAQSRFYFTWNVNQCVLWETDAAKDHRDHNYKSWDVTNVSRESHMLQAATQDTIKLWLIKFLNQFADILRGTSPIGTKSPDEKFIEILEASLSVPILLTFDALTLRYKKKTFRRDLDAWMRDEQGWTISDDPEHIRDNIERAAKFACYALVNKLVFYEALLKRYGTDMDKLEIPDHVDTGEALRPRMEHYFARAKETTGDYETVFGEDHKSIGNRIPFYADAAVVHWRLLINQIHEFDFSRLDYEVIGSIFERLIAPEERRKYGQFYTRVEVVDLINSFCIRDGTEKVMDPACGGGTFLVRSYARKRELDPGRTHGQLLQDLFGVDRSHFAAHLTTINLATRDLIDDENYPQILRSDFFDVVASKTFVVLPKRGKSKGLGKIQHRKVDIPQLDAIIGNPPYIRQEQIPKARKKGEHGLEPGTKEYYRDLVKTETGAMLSGRSDIHCYFWPHAATFLKQDGYLCLLTSSQWLDVEYGFKLQEYLQRNFEIIAVFESIDEPWFVGARVATTVTILRRQLNESERMNNVVRFVQLRRPIAELLAHDDTTLGAIQAADEFRNEILALKKNTVNERFRARLVCQGDLWREGVRLGMIMGRSSDSKNEDPDSQSGDYFGGKWGVHLRAPDLWFELMDECGNRFAPLGDIAEIRRGITSGKDSFFFPRDTTKECLARNEEPKEFKKVYGVSRKRVASGAVKLVKCGEGYGEIRPIESKFLEPEVHSLMEIKGFTVSPEDCARMILLVAKKKELLRGTCVFDYINWGERQGYDKGATCAARVSESREWYDLTGHRRAPTVWPKERQYRHIAPMNPKKLIANCRLYEIYPLCTSEDPTILSAILNSSVTLLSSLQYGRPVGNEGNWSTMVVDANMMVVPDIRKVEARLACNLEAAFSRMALRKPLQFLSERRMREMAYRQKGKEADLEKLSDECELDMEDRRALDDAVLQMLGVRSKKHRNDLIDRLYAHLRDHFEWTRQKEEKAIANKKRSARKGGAQPNEIAKQIFEEISESESFLLRKYEDFFNRNEPFDTYEMPREGRAEPHHDMLIPHGVRLVKNRDATVEIIEVRSDCQVRLLVLIAGNMGHRDFVPVPHDQEECERVLDGYGTFLAKSEQRMHKLVAERTADEDLQDKVYDVLIQMVRQN